MLHNVVLTSALAATLTLWQYCLALSCSTATTNLIAVTKSMMCWYSQVTEHPPVSAAHAENEHFTYDIVSAPATKFQGNSLEVYPKGKPPAQLALLKTAGSKQHESVFCIPVGIAFWFVGFWSASSFSSQSGDSRAGATQQAQSAAEQHLLCAGYNKPPAANQSKSGISIRLCDARARFLTVLAAVTCRPHKDQPEAYTGGFQPCTTPGQGP